jgi:hypothetical protein
VASLNSNIHLDDVLSTLPESISASITRAGVNHNITANMEEGEIEDKYE